MSSDSLRNVSYSIAVAVQANRVALQRRYLYVFQCSSWTLQDANSPQLTVMSVTYGIYWRVAMAFLGARFAVSSRCFRSLASSVWAGVLLRFPLPTPVLYQDLAMMSIISPVLCCHPIILRSYGLTNVKCVSEGASKVIEIPIIGFNGCGSWLARWLIWVLRKWPQVYKRLVWVVHCCQVCGIVDQTLVLNDIDGLRIFTNFYN